MERACDEMSTSVPDYPCQFATNMCRRIVDISVVSEPGTDVRAPVAISNHVAEVKASLANETVFKVIKKSRTPISFAIDPQESLAVKEAMG